MTRQKSEGRTVLQRRRKAAVTRRVERAGGGKATPVNEQAGQLGLGFETAENPAGTVGGTDWRARSSVTHAAPKSKHKDEPALSATMEEVVRRLRGAFRNVASNHGAPGPDGRSIEEVREHLDELLPELSRALLEGTYRPGSIRRVWIPKAGGGKRGLGIPDVVDRMVQEAVRQVLEPQYEPTFHPNSHGFRPGRSCHTAIDQARSYLEEGYDWVVDLDLKDFFNQVNHQRLLARLAQRVEDKRLVVLVGRMLKAKVVLPNGVLVSTEQGTPQGGPLSPLLSNIVLDELDWELDRRGHRFVRYADDGNVYVRSERAGQRVMASLTQFIERRLRLEVNEAKSAVARPEERHFLGFRLRREPNDGEVEVLLSRRSEDRLKAKVREMTPRNWGSSLDACIQQINGYFRGWMGHFSICTAEIERVLHWIDAHVRRRLRAIQLKHWKRRRTIVKRLMQLGINRRSAWRSVYKGRRSIWAMSHMATVDKALRNSHWDDRGLLSLKLLWRARRPPIGAPVQLQLQWALG